MRSAASLFPPSEIDASSLASHDPTPGSGGGLPSPGPGTQNRVMIANSAVTLSTWPAPSYPNVKNMVYVLCVLSAGAGKLTFF